VPVDREVIKQVTVVDPTTARALEQTETDLANAVLVIQDRQKELADLKLRYQQLENDYTESSKYIEDQNKQIQELRQSGAVEIKDHLGNVIQMHVPGQEPKPVPKRKGIVNEVVVPDLSINAEGLENPTNAGFGTRFPDNPVKGDVFLRMDYLPSKLFKWNEKKWIEVDKDITDRYAYDEQYIKHLVEKLRSGEYDYDMLNAIEQEQIERYINGTTKQ